MTEARSLSELPRPHRAPFTLDKSRALTEEAKALVPGVTHSMMKRPEMFDEGACPAFLSEGQGALVRDVDGNEYIDFVCGLGATTLGHHHPAMDEALHRAVTAGHLFSLPTELELQAARAVSDVLPGAEMVRFFKTGADATSAALRLARHLTGREQVVVVGYNGWHDHFMFDTPGVPKALAGLTHRLPLFQPHDEVALLDLLEERGEELAVVLLSAPYNRPLSRDFLRALRERCTEQGVLLVLDEIVTGFRVALGGLQEKLGVQADFVCVSKGLAAGMPLSAVAGPRAHLAPMAELQVSTTFGGECLSLAACVAAIEVYRSSDYIEHIHALGRRLADGINAYTVEKELPLRIMGYAPIPLFGFHPDMAMQAKLARPFVGAMAKRGVILRRDVNFISYAHTAAQIDFTIAACRDALDELRMDGKL